MAERLTGRNSDGAYFDGTNGKCAMDKYGRTYGEAAEKLAHYEDLEEHGRLVVLPERFDKEKLFKALAHEQCPAHFGLPIINCNYESCKECWEVALRGE